MRLISQGVRVQAFDLFRWLWMHQFSFRSTRRTWARRARARSSRRKIDRKRPRDTRENGRTARRDKTTIKWQPRLTISIIPTVVNNFCDLLQLIYCTQTHSQRTQSILAATEPLAASLIRCRIVFAFSVCMCVERMPLSAPTRPKPIRFSRENLFLNLNNGSTTERASVCADVS